METKQNEKLSNYLKVLRKAKNDNEKFATLLMVAKVTKGETCSKNDMRDILDAAGPKFIGRLLKTKNVPDDCSETIFKSVAMSVLSALCAEPDVASSPVVTENIASFNSIILLNPGDEDVEGRQLVDDTYLCINSLCQSPTGIEAVLQNQSMSALCKAITSEAYGHEKSQDMINYLVSYTRTDAWKGTEESFCDLLSHLSQRFATDMGKEKFDLCKTLVFLLTYTPENLNKSEEPPWLNNIVQGLADILKSKIGAAQREPALRLVSMLVHVCGIYCILPPFTSDCKLFLLTTHLCCVEVRMVLEAYDIHEANKNGHLLTSCYTFLETIINHLSQGPSLHLEDRQILQLHSAMLGAFSAVLHFLKRVAADSSVQWNTIILATVRVLSAWLAEETAALKDEVIELIPFLLQISKMCIPPAGAYDKTQKTVTETDESSTSVEEKIDKDKEDLKNTKKSVKLSETDSSELSSQVANVTLENKESNNKIEGESIENDNKIVENSDDLVKDTDSKLAETSDDVKKQTDIHEDLKTCDDNGVKENGDEKSKNIESMKSDPSVAADNDGRSIFDGELLIDKEVLTEEELAELHMNTDIFHFLLPGLCHLTAEDKPRSILLECGALDMLDLYMWRQWEKFVNVPAARNVQAGWSSLVILCNIFLNLIIVEQAIVTENPVFAHVLLLVVKSIEIVEHDEDYMVLWSHMITLGLMLLRPLHAKIDEGFEPETISRFFISTVKFLSGAYTGNYEKKNQPYLDIAAIYQNTWDQISQTWFLSMQALCACVSLYKNLPTLILSTGWLPALLKVTLDVKGNGIAEETRSCFLMLLTTVARSSSTARKVIQEKGGAEFARVYKSDELKEALKVK